MDVSFCRFLVLLYVFTGPITCNNLLQTLKDETRLSKHPTVEDNINYLVSKDGGKRKTPPNRHLMAFKTRRRLIKRSESSSEEDRSRNRLRIGSLSAHKITATGNNGMVVPYKVRQRKPTMKGSKRTKTNRKDDEFKKQITKQREDNTRNMEAQPGFKKSKSGSSPAIALDQFYLNLPIYETYKPSGTVDQQNGFVGPYYVNEDSRDSSQSSDEKRKHNIQPDQSEIDNSGTKTRIEPRKRPRKKDRNSSPLNGGIKSEESKDESSSAEDHTKISKDSRKEVASTTLKTHFFTLTTQSVDITAPSTAVTSSFGKVTTSYSTSKQIFKTVEAEVTKEIHSHRGTTTKVAGVTSSTLVTTVSDFPTPSPSSGNGMLTDLEFTTRTFLVTKFPQNEAKRASTTTIRTPKPSPKDPVTIGPVKDFITNQGSIPITIVGVISASIVAVAMVATSSFIGSRRSLSRGRSPSLATLPENIELHDA